MFLLNYHPTKSPYLLQLCCTAFPLLRLPIWTGRSVSTYKNLAIGLSGTREKLVESHYVLHEVYSANKMPWLQIHVEPFEIKMKKCSLVGARSKMNNMQ